MELKKSKRSDLERKRITFFQTGLLIALSGVLIAFEWTTVQKGDKNLYAVKGQEVFEPEIINTFHQPKEIKPPEPPKVVEKIELVPNDEKVEDFPPLDVGADQSTAIAQYNILNLEEESNVEDSIFFNPEEGPTFGSKGISAFRDYIMENVKYTDAAANAGIEGTITVEFVITNNGTVGNVKILRGIHPSMDEQVRQAIKQSKGWRPGKQAGRPVSVKLFIPIKFQLI